MKSSRTSSSESARETANKQLSQVLLQAVDAGMLQPEVSGDGWIFQISMCPAHAMVNLPKCLMRIEVESAATTIAA